MLAGLSQSTSPVVAGAVVRFFFLQVSATNNWLAAAENRQVVLSELQRPT